MSFLVIVFLFVMTVYLLFQWTALRKSNSITRWLAYAIYALAGGLWVMFFMWTEHQYLVKYLDRVLHPFVPFKF